MQNIREKIKRKLSLHDKNPTFDEHMDENDVDEETHGHLHREIERSEAEGHPEGRPGSFLNRMISHGNKKTEDQILREAAQRELTLNAKENQQPIVTSGTTTGTTTTGAPAGTRY